MSLLSGLNCFQNLYLPQYGCFFLESTMCRSWFKGSQEVIFFSEILFNSIDHMNQILYVDDATFTMRLRNHSVIFQGNCSLLTFHNHAYRFIHPHAAHGPNLLTVLNFLIEAWLSLTKVLLKLWQKWKSCNPFQIIGLKPLMPLILTDKHQFGFCRYISKNRLSNGFSCHPTVQISVLCIFQYSFQIVLSCFYFCFCLFCFFLS